MSTGGRRGRRDNGLVAAAYAAAGDVDPRVGEHLLDVLASSGIAAYLQPASDLHPVTLTSTVPARPTDRLYVDRDQIETARGYLRQLDPEPPADRPGERHLARGPSPAQDPGPARDPGRPADELDPTGHGRDGDHGPAKGLDPAGDVDAAWARIVAAYHADGGADRPWPEPAEDDTPPGARLPKSEYAERSLLDALDTFGAGLPDSDDEGYTPPPPPPLPRPSGAVVLAVVGIVAGLVVFLRPSTLPVNPDLAMFLGFTAVLAGFAALVWRLRPGDDEDAERDPDDGAVV
ncbi:MAG TPA: DUF308 domain-containing protein [Micromonosporaceae bacterium]|nr:DUF308 domain-containing protein [Micromonosporaceae bacterium]